MKNKKGQVALFIIFFVVIIICVLAVLFLKDVSTQTGTSKDIVQGYDKGIIWYHAYLKNDHFTAYCFDDERFIPLLENSQKNNREIIIYYEKYIGRGFFCGSAENYENVVITDIQEIGEEKNGN